MGARILPLLIAVLVALGAQQASALSPELEAILTEHSATIQKGSRKSIQPAIDALAGSGSPEAAIVLEKWREKELWARKEDGAFFLAEKAGDVYALLDIVTGEKVGEAAKKALKQIKPNSGVRGLISTALVQFQLSDPDPAKRAEALDVIQRDPEPELLAPLRASIESEPDSTLAERKRIIAAQLAARFAEDEAERIEAINSLSGSLSLDARAALNPILASSFIATGGADPEGNVAGRVDWADLMSRDEALSLLTKAGLVAAPVSRDEKKAALVGNIVGRAVGGVPVAELGDPAKRDAAYAALAAAGQAPEAPTEAELDAALGDAAFWEVYAEPSAAVTAAAEDALSTIETKVQAFTFLDLTLDGLSLASIYFLAAIGLAVTFGVMGVINMAHGEFIMMGAYTGYVVQLFIPDYTVSLIVALPLAFAVTFAAGVALERSVIRWLYDRPLETLLATFGVSIALQQIAKNVFGTQARPLTSPDWLDGALVINEVVSISWIRVAIFVLGLAFLILLLFIMNRTRLGLEVRAVTQNPRMAASMGIDPDRIRMLTFGLGSGIAGIAGVAIGLYAKVTSGLGQDYIVQSFMTVVVGGVGNLFGVLTGAGLVGAMQKGIEWFNPSNTLAAQTYMIIFIIIFIQFRPKGIFALKGRAAGD